MADCYVDDTNGDDGTGDGSSGSPYKSIQYALDNFGSWDTSLANTLHLANTSPFVLSSPINFDGAPNTVASDQRPLGVVAWDNGGSITGTGPWGQVISPCAEIDGNDAVSSICDASTRYVIFYNLKLHSTTDVVLDLFSSTGLFAIDCEIYDGGLGSILAKYGNYLNCRIYNNTPSTTSGSYGVLINGGLIIGCEIFGVNSGINLSSNNVAIGNYIHDVNESGIYTSGDYTVCINNTIDGTGAASDGYGFKASSVNSRHSVILNNIIVNWDGASAIGLYGGGATGTQAIVGHNTFFNNTTDMLNGPVPIDLTANDITEISNPLASDFTLLAAALSHNAAYQVMGNVDLNIGAWQEKFLAENRIYVNRKNQSGGSAF